MVGRHLPLSKAIGFDDYVCCLGLYPTSPPITLFNHPGIATQYVFNKISVKYPYIN